MRRLIWPSWLDRCAVAFSIGLWAPSDLSRAVRPDLGVSFGSRVLYPCALAESRQSNFRQF